MTQKNDLTTKPNQPASLVKPLLIGAGIALILILLFLSGVKEPNPDWGKFWMIKPLIIVPLTGVLGGAFYYLMNYLSRQGKLNSTVAIILSLIAYVIILWMGTVVGLDGTLWD